MPNIFASDDTFRRLMALVGIVLGMICVLLLLAVDVPESNQSVFFSLLGTIVGAVVVGPMAFYFGSSEGSKAKARELESRHKGE